MRKRLIIALGMLAAFVAACSFVLDLEPDCDQVSDCTPYVCNGENTACLSYCRDDLDCAEGFICQRLGDACISKGCASTGPSRSLFSLEGTGFEFDVARVGDGFQIIAASSEGVGLIGVTADGQVEGGSGAFVTLDTAPSLPVDPVAVATDDGVTVFWRGEPAEDRFDLRVFHVDAEAGPSGPSVVYQGRPGQRLDDLSAARVGSALTVVWSTFVERVQVQLLPLNLDGTYGDESLETAPNEAALIVTDEDTGSSLPAAAATVERAAVVRRETVSGANSVVVSFLDSSFEAINDHTVGDTPGTGITRVDASGMSNAVAVAWIETIEGTPTLLRAVDDESGTILFGQASQDFTTDPTDLDVAAGSTEFAIVWVAEDAQRDVFMRRFDETGQPLFVTFSASDRTTTDPARPNAVRTADGYAVFWVEESVDPPILMFRRFVCSR